MGVDGVMDKFFLPAIKWAAESTANAEMLTGRAQRYAQVVVKQAQLLREHGRPS
jgi:tagatose-1,6-bisphosphate aldolase